MKAMIINKNGETNLIDFEIDNVLEQSYRELNCSLIDIVSVKIKGTAFDIIVDDEGLMKQNPKLTVSSNLRKLFGTVMIVPNETDDEGGYVRGLNEEEIETLYDHITTIVDLDNNNIFRAILSFIE